MHRRIRRAKRVPDVEHGVEVMGERKPTSQEAHSHGGGSRNLAHHQELVLADRMGKLVDPCGDDVATRRKGYKGFEFGTPSSTWGMRTLTETLSGGQRDVLHRVETEAIAIGEGDPVTVHLDQR
jgi:hypothetical protein